MYIDTTHNRSVVSLNGTSLTLETTLLKGWSRNNVWFVDSFVVLIKAYQLLIYTPSQWHNYMSCTFRHKYIDTMDCIVLRHVSYWFTLHRSDMSCMSCWTLYVYLFNGFDVTTISMMRVFSQFLLLNEMILSLIWVYGVFYTLASSKL